MIAAFDSALENGFIERQRHGAGGGVAVFFEVVEDAVAVDLQDVDGGVDDADVGLVGNVKVDVFGLHVRIREHILNRVAKNGDSPAEDGPAIHVHEMEALVEIFGRGRHAAAARGPAEKIAAGTIGAEAVRDQALLGRPLADEHGSSPIAKEGETS